MDALVTLSLPVRSAPGAIAPVCPGVIVHGPARPVIHNGSVDVFLEAIEQAQSGDILVVDNGGRLDEGCLGDLTALEAKMAGVAGVVIWGAHRDTRQLREIGLLIWSLGACAKGPVRLDHRAPKSFSRAQLGDIVVSGADWVFADDDGVAVVDASSLSEVVEVANDIAAREATQARRMAQGETLRAQLAFSDYLEKSKRDPSLTFRAHIKGLGGAIET